MADDPASINEAGAQFGIRGEELTMCFNGSLPNTLDMIRCLIYHARNLWEDGQFVRLLVWCRSKVSVIEHTRYTPYRLLLDGALEAHAPQLLTSIKNKSEGGKLPQRLMNEYVEFKWNGITLNVTPELVFGDCQERFVPEMRSDIADLLSYDRHMATKYLEAFGACVYALMQLKNISYRGLAQSSGIAHQTVQKMYVSLQLIKLLCPACARPPRNYASRSGAWPQLTQGCGLYVDTPAIGRSPRSRQGGDERPNHHLLS